MFKMKKNLILILCSGFALFSRIEAQEPALESIMINLGENCSARAALEAVGIKQESYPFDSCIIPFDSLILTLADDFNHYTNPDYFTPYIDEQSPINKYGVVLAHNFPLVCIGKKPNGEELWVMDPEWRKFLPDIQIKYERRINRFRKACLSSKKVCFFRYLDINYSKAKQLSELLHVLYPHLDFVLLCVENQSHPFARSWHLPRVKNYYYNTQAPLPVEEWKRIFREALLLPNSE